MGHLSLTGSWGPQRNFSSPEVLYNEQTCSWRWTFKHPSERRAGSPSRGFHFAGPEGKITHPAGIQITLPAQIPLFLAGLTPCRVPAAHSAPGALPPPEHFPSWVLPGTLMEIFPTAAWLDPAGPRVWRIKAGYEIKSGKKSAFSKLKIIEQLVQLWWKCHFPFFLVEIPLPIPSTSSRGWIITQIIRAGAAVGLGWSLLAHSSPAPGGFFISEAFYFFFLCQWILFSRRAAGNKEKLL